MCGICYFCLAVGGEMLGMCGNWYFSLALSEQMVCWRGMRYLSSPPLTNASFLLRADFAHPARLIDIILG